MGSGGGETVLLLSRDCRNVSEGGGASPMEERDIWELEPCDELKWDDWEDHMTILANQFNEVEFHVERNGENEEDWLVALFKGDKKQIRYGFPPIDHWAD